MTTDSTPVISALRRYEAVHGAPLRLKAALIDMDGTLYDSMKYHSLAWLRMISEAGIPCTRDEFYLYEGMTGRATIDLLFRRHFGRPATPQEAEELYARKSRYFVEMGRKEVMPGAKEMTRLLAEAGIRRVLVTGSAQSTLLRSLDADFPGIFPPEARVTARDVSKGKPDPEPYLMGLEKAGVAPEEAIVIENAPLGVQSGVAAGCFTVGITTGPILQKELAAAGAHLVCASMPEFAAMLPEFINLAKPKP